jgi:hypothetical protein
MKILPATPHPENSKRAEAKVATNKPRRRADCKAFAYRDGTQPYPPVLSEQRRNLRALKIVIDPGAPKDGAEAASTASSISRLIVKASTDYLLSLRESSRFSRRGSRRCRNNHLTRANIWCEGRLSTLCGTRRALEVVRALPFKLGRVRRIGGSANYPSAGLGVNYSADRPLTGAEEGVVGSGRRRPWSARMTRRRVRSTIPGTRAHHRSETSVEAERCLDHTGPAPVRGAKTSPRLVQPCHR